MGANSYLSRLDRGRGPDPPPRIPPFLPDRSFSTRATLPVRAASSSSWSFPIVSHRVRYRVLSLLRSSSRSTPQKPGPSPPHPKRMPGLQHAEIPRSPAQGAARRPPSPGAALQWGAARVWVEGLAERRRAPTATPLHSRGLLPAGGVRAGGDWARVLPRNGRRMQSSEEDAEHRECQALGRMLRR